MSALFNLKETKKIYFTYFARAKWANLEFEFQYQLLVTKRAQENDLCVHFFFVMSLN